MADRLLGTKQALTLCWMGGISEGAGHLLLRDEPKIIAHQAEGTLDGCLWAIANRSVGP